MEVYPPTAYLKEPLTALFKAEYADSKTAGTDRNETPNASQKARSHDRTVKRSRSC